MENARKVFDQMPHRETVVWNLMINGFCKINDFKTAFLLFRKMSDRNVLTWNTMLARVSRMEPNELRRVHPCIRTPASPSPSLSLPSPTHLSHRLLCGYRRKFGLENGFWSSKVVIFVNKERTNDMTGKARDTAAGAKERSVETAQAAKDKTSEKAQTVKERAREGKDKTVGLLQ